MKFLHRSRRALASYAVAAFAAVVATACSATDSSGPVQNPLDGLVRVQATGQHDTATGSPSAPGKPSTYTGPGFVQGVVHGYSISSAGYDTSFTSQGLAGVAVSAYVQSANGGATGNALGSTATDASGKWQLAGLPGGGPFVITFVPPAGSPYEGGWTVLFAGPASAGAPVYGVNLLHK